MRKEKTKEAYAPPLPYKYTNIYTHTYYIHTYIHTYIYITPFHCRCVSVCVCVCVCGAIPCPACLCCSRLVEAPPLRLHARERPQGAAQSCRPVHLCLCEREGEIERERERERDSPITPNGMTPLIYTYLYIFMY